MFVADDTALVCSSRKDMVLAAEVLNEVVSERDLTQLLAAGIDFTEGDWLH